ncbi:hypothetical protein Hypma_004496 [Hypsizygus marmoreus]|uniref:DUF4100 domain-containing protein n=1 Tax=Hypsizygus marmoreus TaxID=39966 RepID=A0A369K8K2_HYPMA|nr:hypothetical protein Hypma_004496 [Hypsizygus marmoreus]
MAGTLVTDGNLLQKDANLCFYRGWLRAEFNQEDLDAQIDDVDVDVETGSDDSDSEEDVELPKIPKKKLTKQLEELKIFQAELIRLHRASLTQARPDFNRPNFNDAQQHNGNAGGRPDFNRPNFPDVPRNEQRCFICDQTTHRLGAQYCPEVAALLADKLITFNSNGRLVLFDGSDLPRAYHSDGGVAKVIRQQQASSGNLKEDVRHDPHTTAKRPPKKTSDAPSSSRPQPANPHQTRSKATNAPQPNVPAPAPTVSNPPPQVHPSQPPPINTQDAFKNNKRVAPPKPKNDVEMHDGTKPAGRPGPSYHFTSSIQEMVNVDSLQEKILSTPITLTLRELIGSSPELQRRIANLTKTRREYTEKPVVANLVDRFDDRYEETLQEMMKNREVNCTWSSVPDESGPMIEEVDLDDEGDDVDDIPPESFVTVDLGDGLCHSHLQVDFDPSQDTEEDILERYANAAKSAVQIHPNPLPLFAMVTGRFRGTFGGATIYFMVDTGSELNLVSSELSARIGLPIDMDGTRWSLKGINGNPVALGGCVRDVPVSIGGHRFDHHFFVSQEGVGTGKQDVILGQPWLMWYEASLAYTRKGTMRMRIWQHGDSDDIPATVSVTLCNADAPRNATALNLDNRYKATVEDVPEDQEN